MSPTVPRHRAAGYLAGHQVRSCLRDGPSCLRGGPSFSYARDGCPRKRDPAGREPRGLEGGVSTQLSSSATEFTELSSRKTSSASSFFYKSPLDGWPSNSTSPYEDRLLQTKDEGKDRWEFPRHHLKFYGILGKSLYLASHHTRTPTDRVAYVCARISTLFFVYFV